VALDDYLRARGIDINGSFAVSDPVQGGQVGVPLSLSSAKKKALTMAALIEAYGGEGSVKTVRFYDDGDSNLKAAMELLPRLFPELKFEFIDVIHTAVDRFEHVLVARTGDEPGSLVTPDGYAFTDELIRSYYSVEAPFIPDPAFESQPG
jgi:hypothetical protein